MRISTTQIYSSSVTSLNNLQVQIAQTTQQISTGQRILDPSMDPVGAARAMELTLSDSTNTQHAANNTAATNTLSLSEGILQNVTSILQSAQDTVLSANSPLVNDAIRKSTASALQGVLSDLYGLANSTDGVGNYLYSGAQGSVQPFVNTATGVAYQGDDAQRNMQVSPSRQIASTDSGADIFMRIRNGNGTFQTSLPPAPLPAQPPATSNTGTGTISQGMVTDATLYTGQSYKVVFNTANTYDIQAVPGGAVLASGAYVSGQAIAYGGIQFEIKGAPAAGDSFDIKPSSNQSVFDTLSKLIATLNTPLTGATPANTAAISQAMSDGLASLNQDMNNVLGIRATTGSRLNELTALQDTSAQLGLQYKKTLSTIQDTDYNKAITDLTQQKLILQAAQQSFAQVSKLTLFNYM